jgi:CheY-like chemotaxis protein
MTILVVDDDEEIGEALADWLDDAGCQVLSARSTTQALETARAQRPTLVLLDWHMGPTTGEEFLAAIASEPALAGLPIYLMTGDNALAASAPPGVVDTLRKPLDVHKLEKILASYRR